MTIRKLQIESRNGSDYETLSKHEMFGTGSKMVYESPLSYRNDEHSFDEFKCKN